MIPMGIWFAGLPVAIGCALWNCKHSRRFARRLFGQLPVFMALGINFAIVPLLFLQTTYYKSFYTATILMGWHWLVVIPILIVGYYSLYLAAFSRHEENDERRPKRMILFGIIASLSLIAIGILITNGLTLMVRSDLWSGIMERTNYYGATTGLANNMRDSAVWVRLATMFSLGLMTTGVWAAFDSHFLCKNNEENEQYRRWTVKLTTVVVLIGYLIFCSVAIPSDSAFFEVVRTAYPVLDHFSLRHVAALGFGLILIAIFAAFSKTTAKKYVLGMTVMQILILAGFGILRQIGQNTGVANYVDVSKIPTDIQWTPLVSFLVLFVIGLLTIVWMVRQCVICVDDSSASTPPG